MRIEAVKLGRLPEISLCQIELASLKRKVAQAVQCVCSWQYSPATVHTALARRLRGLTPAEKMRSGYARLVLSGESCRGLLIFGLCLISAAHSLERDRPNSSGRRCNSGAQQSRVSENLPPRDIACDSIARFLD